MDTVRRVLSTLISIVLSFWGPVIGATIATGGTIVAAYLGALPLANQIVLGLGAAAFSLFFFNQFALFFNRTRKRMSQKSNEEIENELWTWLKRQGYSLKQTRSVSHEEASLFDFLATDDNMNPAIPISVLRLKDSPNIITLITSIGTREEDKRAMQKNLPPEKQRQLVSEMRIELARFGIMFQGLDVPLNRVDLLHHISVDDSLTEFKFSDQVMYMKRAAMLLLELQKRAVTQSEMARPTPQPRPGK